MRRFDSEFDRKIQKSDGVGVVLVPFSKHNLGQWTSWLIKQIPRQSSFRIMSVRSLLCPYDTTYLNLTIRVIQMNK